MGNTLRCGPVVAGLLFTAGVVTIGAQAPPSTEVATRDAFFEFLIAQRLEDAGDNAGALAALERALTSDPQSAEVQAEIAALHYRSHDRESAAAAAEAALGLDPDNVEAHRVLGLITAAYADAGAAGRPGSIAELVQEAIEHLQRAVDSAAGSTDVGLQYTLGRLHLRAGSALEAVSVLSDVVEQSPNSAQARLSLAQAYANSDQLDGAIETLAAIVERVPRVAAALGQYQEQAGRFIEAADSFTIALQSAPNNPELKLRRIVVLFSAERYGAAADLAVEAFDQHPDDDRFLRLRASALFEDGDPDAAFEVLNRAVELRPQDGGLQLALADLYHDAERIADAERTLRQLVEAQPGNADALNYLGYLLADDGRALDEAVELVRRALDLDPGNPSYLDSLGWAYYRQGALEESERFLVPAAQQLPDNSVILDHLGDLRAMQGRLDEAVASWEAALGGDGADIDREAVERKISSARQGTAREP